VSRQIDVRADAGGLEPAEGARRRQRRRSASDNGEDFCTTPLAGRFASAGSRWRALLRTALDTEAMSSDRARKRWRRRGIGCLVCAASLVSCRASSLSFTVRDGATQVVQGERALAEYRVDGRFKPYVAGLWTPDGFQVLRDSPPDHSHHHGLMFALGIGDVDFWGEVNTQVPGAQRGSRPTTRVIARTGEARAVVEQHVAWVDLRDNETLAQEERRIEVRPGGSGGPTRLTWRSCVRPASGMDSVELWGRPYFGLGIRFVADLDRVGRFVTPEGRSGERVRGDERLVRSRWCAYVVRTGERAVTVAMFDHPQNPRHPATWFTMAKPFAYLCATLALSAERTQVAAGRPLRLCYGVALWDDLAGTDRIEAQYRSWLAATNEQEARR